MISRPSNQCVGLLLSGGLDSCILLGRLLQKGHRVQPFYIQSGLFWQRQELRCLKRFVRAVVSPRLEELVVLELPLADLYRDHWAVTGRHTPDATSPEQAVYLPGRNALLTIKAALWCRLYGINKLALAVLRSNPFFDATSGFFDDFQSALNCATGGRVRILRPFARLGKREVMKLGRGLHLEMTFSCLAPVGNLHCGRCNKCAERNSAFRLIGADDPTRYATAPGY